MISLLGLIYIVPAIICHRRQIQTTVLSFFLASLARTRHKSSLGSTTFGFFSGLGCGFVRPSSATGVTELSCHTNIIASALWSDVYRLMMQVTLQDYNFINHVGNINYKPKLCLRGSKLVVGLLSKYRTFKL